MHISRKVICFLLTLLLPIWFIVSLVLCLYFGYFPMALWLYFSISIILALFFMIGMIKYDREY